MDVMTWLLDADPAIRWQVLRDLADAPAEEVAGARAEIETTGWGATLLDRQAADGRWDDGVYRPGWVDDDRPFFDAWSATHFVLQELWTFGADPNGPRVAAALDRVREHVRWDTDGEPPYFEGETEPCINGVVLAVGARFGQQVDALARRLAGEALADGGWNCWAAYGATASSFSTTICVLEGLLEWELAGGNDVEVTAARHAAEEYLLDRVLLRRRHDWRLVDPRFTMFSFPTRWYYDALRALEYFRRSPRDRDARLSEAVSILRDRADAAGRWPLENVHQGPVQVEYEDREGAPSRWNTLRALRVLRWWDDAPPLAVPGT